MQDRMLFASPGEADKQSNGKALQSAERWELACVRVLCDMPISPGEGSEHHCNSRNAFMGYQKQRSSECFPCKMSTGKKKKPTQQTSWKLGPLVETHYTGENKKGGSWKDRENRMHLGAELWVYGLTLPPVWARFLIESKRGKGRRVGWNVCPNIAIL